MCEMPGQQLILWVLPTFLQHYNDDLPSSDEQIYRLLNERKESLNNCATHPFFVIVSMLKFGYAIDLCKFSL